jgi:hypothetical protein
VDVLHPIAAQEAWCLSRLRATVAVYDSAEATAAAGALGDHGQPPVAPHGVGDCAVSLGADRLPCRFLAYRLPADIVEQRRRQAYETARKKGRTPPHTYLHWFQYGGYITNVGATVWAAEVGATGYRIRWQIEIYQSCNLRRTLFWQKFDSVSPHTARRVICGAEAWRLIPWGWPPMCGPLPCRTAIPA